MDTTKPTPSAAKKPMKCTHPDEDVCPMCAASRHSGQASAVEKQDAARSFELLEAQRRFEADTEPQQGDIDLDQLVRCVREIYSAGVWKCDSLPEATQLRLWMQLRDAAGIKKGFATARGVAPMSEPTPTTSATEADIIAHEWFSKQRFHKQREDAVSELAAIVRRHSGQAVDCNCLPLPEPPSDHCPVHGQAVDRQGELTPAQMRERWEAALIQLERAETELAAERQRADNESKLRQEYHRKIQDLIGERNAAEQAERELENHKARAWGRLLKGPNDL